MDDGWIGHRIRYDLEGAEGGLPFSPDAYQGDLILLINEDNTKMREIYIYLEMNGYILDT